MLLWPLQLSHFSLNLPVLSVSWPVNWLLFLKCSFHKYRYGSACISHQVFVLLSLVQWSIFWASCLNLWPLSQCSKYFLLLLTFSPWHFLPSNILYVWWRHWFVLMEYTSRLYLLGLLHFGGAYYSSLLMECMWKWCVLPPGQGG